MATMKESVGAEDSGLSLLRDVVDESTRGWSSFFLTFVRLEDELDDMFLLGNGKEGRQHFTFSLGVAFTGVLDD